MDLIKNLFTRLLGWTAFAAVPFVVLFSGRSLPWTKWMFRPLDDFTFWLILGVAEALLLLVLIVFDRRIVMTFRFALKSLSRNLLRSILTALAVIREDSVLGCWCHPPLCHTWVVWDEWLRLYALRPAA